MTERPTPPSAAEDAFREMTRAIKNWTENHMDQWELFKFKTEQNTVYVSVTFETPYEDSFDEVNPETGETIRQAGIENKPEPR